MSMKRFLVAAGLGMTLVLLGFTAAHATVYGKIEANFLGVYQKNQGASYYADTDCSTYDINWSGYPGYDSSKPKEYYDDYGSTIAGLYHFKTTKSSYNTYAPLGKDTDFGTFCVDLVQYIGQGVTYRYTVTDLDNAPTPPGAAMHKIWPGQKSDLERLYYGYYDLAKFASDDNEAAAFGLAVWEIVCEHWESSYTVTSGSFKTSSRANARANTILSNLPTIPPNVTPPELVAFVSDCSQDQMWVLTCGGVQYVPEPLTMLGLALGLGSVGVYVRRRRLA